MICTKSVTFEILLDLVLEMSLVRYIGSWEYKHLTKFPFLKKYDANRFVRNGIHITNTFKVYNTGTTRSILCVKIVTELVRSEVIYQWHVPVL